MISTPLPCSSAMVASMSSHMRYRSVPPPSSAGWAASSAGGSAKMRQPPPASTDAKPRTSARKARSAPASLENMTACIPVIMPGSLNQMEPLRDGHGRLIRDLRVSVTDRCNFRCQYCMPAEGLPWLERADVLAFEELERLVGLFAAMGVRDLRLTGGEPLVRRDFPRLAAMLAPLVDDLAVTTNGFLLERDAEALVGAGINRFNVSIDSLQRDRFFEMTRRDALPRVLRGLEHLGTFPEAHPIKVNAVAMRGFTEDEVLPFARFARSHPYEVRFIEFMPLDADHAWDRDKVLTGEEVRAAIHAEYPLEPEPLEPSATARVYRFADGHGRIGFINPVSEPFCGDCDRIRITAEGKLRTCLFSHNETDLRDPMRNGASDDDLELIIRDAVWRKELKHHVNEPGFIQP